MKRSYLYSDIQVFVMVLDIQSFTDEFQWRVNLLVACVLCDTCFKNKYVIQLDLLIHFYLNHFCLFNYTMLMTDFRYLRRGFLD